jgi:hypothetical protein
VSYVTDDTLSALLHYDFWAKAVSIPDQERPMSSNSLSDFVFVLELHQRIYDYQTELTKVMHDPNRTASERDALIGAIAELKTTLIEHTQRRKKSVDQAALSQVIGAPTVSALLRTHRRRFNLRRWHYLVW